MPYRYLADVDQRMREIIRLAWPDLAQDFSMYICAGVAQLHQAMGVSSAPVDRYVQKVYISNHTTRAPNGEWVVQVVEFIGGRTRAFGMEDVVYLVKQNKPEWGDYYMTMGTEHVKFEVPISYVSNMATYEKVNSLDPTSPVLSYVSKEYFIGMTTGGLELVDILQHAWPDANLYDGHGVMNHLRFEKPDTVTVFDYRGTLEHLAWQPYQYEVQSRGGWMAVSFIAARRTALDGAAEYYLKEHRHPTDKNAHDWIVRCYWYPPGTFTAPEGSAEMTVQSKYRNTIIKHWRCPNCQRAAFDVSAVQFKEVDSGVEGMDFWRERVTCPNCHLAFDQSYALDTAGGVETRMDWGKPVPVPVSPSAPPPDFQSASASASLSASPSASVSPSYSLSPSLSPSSGPPLPPGKTFRAADGHTYVSDGIRTWRVGS